MSVVAVGVAAMLTAAGCRAYQEPTFGSSSKAVDCVIDTGFLFGTTIGMPLSLALLPITLPLKWLLPWERWVEPLPGFEDDFARFQAEQEVERRAAAGETPATAAEGDEVSGSLRAGKKPRTVGPAGPAGLPARGVHPDADDRLWYTVFAPALGVGHVMSWALGGLPWLLHLPWEEGPPAPPPGGGR